MSSFLTRLKITLGKTNADEHALGCLRTDSKVVIKEDKDIVFEPVGNPAKTGVILYPGGRCDARAYAPILKPLAEAGYLVVLPNMPLRMAVIDANRAAKIMATFPAIERWIIGGHSMGGAMAAAFAHNNPGTVAGLFFMGSYAASMHAIPDSDLPVLMISGSRDFITRAAELEAQPERLPAHTKYVSIEGGDHYQFGSFNNGVVTAEISRDEQQHQTVASLLSFLGELDS